MREALFCLRHMHRSHCCFIHHFLPSFDQMPVRFKSCVEECGCPAHAWRYHYRLAGARACEAADLRRSPRRVYIASPEWPGWFTTVDIADWDTQFESFIAECGAMVDVTGCVTGHATSQVVLVEQTQDEHDARRGYCNSLDDWDDDRTHEFDL
jgi:hypothetical protein